eukprot:5953970-Pyramimonas_sp.AAC.3
MAHVLLNKCGSTSPRREGRRELGEGVKPGARVWVWDRVWDRVCYEMLWFAASGGQRAVHMDTSVVSAPKACVGWVG